jgi:DNA-directed RNA polymerase subunit L/DNA-directed RNA polymerase alpha subunit
MDILLSSDLSSFKQQKNWRPEFINLIKTSKYLDTSLVNAIRRYSISKINTVAFDYSPTPQSKTYIMFELNNSNMNNDFIGHRIGLLPINIIGVKYILLVYKILLGHHDTLDKLKTMDELEGIKMLKTNLKLKDNIELINKIQFYFDLTNTSEDVINVTSEYIKFRFMNIDEKIELNLEDYNSKLKSYDYVFKLYEKYNDLNSTNISIENLVRLVFPLFTYQSYSEGVLISKLKKNESLKCKMYLNLGNGDNHSRFSVVSPCTYSFVLDYELINRILIDKLENNKLVLTETNLEKLVGEEYIQIKDFIETRYNNISEFKLNPTLITDKNNFLENNKNLKNISTITNYISDKDLMLNIFNKCDNQRYFKGKEEYELYNREFNLYIESNGFYNSNQILNKAFKLLKSDLLNACNNIIYLLNNLSNYPLVDDNISIDISTKIENGIDIIFNNSNHSIGNIISSYIYYIYDNNIIQYVGYKMVHPLKTSMEITIGFSDKNNMNNTLLVIFTLLLDIFNNTNLDTFTNK